MQMDSEREEGSPNEREKKKSTGVEGCREHGGAKSPNLVLRIMSNCFWDRRRAEKGRKNSVAWGGQGGQRGGGDTEAWPQGRNGEN